MPSFEVKVNSGEVVRKAEFSVGCIKEDLSGCKVCSP